MGASWTTSPCATWSPTAPRRSKHPPHQLQQQQQQQQQRRQRRSKQPNQPNSTVVVVVVRQHPTTSARRRSRQQHQRCLPLFLREKVSIQHEKRSSSAHDCLTNVPSSLSSSLFPLLFYSRHHLSTSRTHVATRAGARARKSDDVDDAMTSRADGRRE